MPASAYEPREITVNIPVTDAERTRILGEERAWSGPRLVVLTGTFLVAMLILLYVMSSTTAEVPYPNWFLP